MTDQLTDYLMDTYVAMTRYQCQMWGIPDPFEKAPIAPAVESADSCPRCHGRLIRGAETSRCAAGCGWRPE